MPTAPPPGFQILISPGYQAVFLHSVPPHTLRANCLELNQFIESLGYQVEDWNANPIYIISPVHHWVLPDHQEQIKRFIGLTPGCKYTRCNGGENPRVEACQLGFLDDRKRFIDLAALDIRSVLNTPSESDAVHLDTKKSSAWSQVLAFLARVFT
ncbi:hypothetical protein [Rhodoferax sp. GW822-FHT02A01]|uniref:hypothetical protein n=1 Tax=Rhodoferax sp. GW822-FHT02A01 TaxID=3141537 RepID=UPI00315C5C7D